MTVVTGWRAEAAIIDGAPVMRYAGVNVGHVYVTWQEVLDDAHVGALKEDADREWVARELGDVPHIKLTERPIYDKWPAVEVSLMDAMMYGTGAYRMDSDGTALPVDITGPWIPSPFSGREGVIRDGYIDYVPAERPWDYKPCADDSRMPTNKRPTGL